MIETAYLIDLFEIFSKKSMQRWLKDSEKVLRVDDDDDGNSESDDNQYNDHVTQKILNFKLKNRFIF